MSEKNTIWTVAVILVAGIGGYLYWHYSQPQAVPVKAPVAVSKPVTEVRRVLETPAAPLPALAESDSFVLDALSGLVGNKPLMKYFVPDRLIRNIVATIDNLPRREIAPKVMPLKPVPGSFFTTGYEGNLTISPQNAGRYAPYVKIIETIDTKKLVALYLQLYPLFQQAYEELGYPKKYFNDRLVVVLDHLLATPDIREPVRVVQPKVFYEYADPDLEARSIGQRILMRIGSRNEAIVKTKLREIKQELLLHVREQKVEGKAEAGSATQGRITRAPGGLP